MSFSANALLQTAGSNINQPVNHFDSLPTDVKLHLFSFLGIDDTIAATSVNRANHSLQKLSKFWQQRLLFDFKIPLTNNINPKGFYIDTYKNRITKIRDLRVFIAGLSNSGHLYVENHSLQNKNSKLDKHTANTILKFSSQNKIIDIAYSEGGTTYILTPNGLFGFGNNYHNQLGLNTNQQNNDLHCLVPSTKGDKVLRFSYGKYLTVVQTQKRLWIAGNIRGNKNKTIEFNISNLDIVNIHCSDEDFMMQLKDNRLILIGSQPDHLRFDGSKITYCEITEFHDKKIIKLERHAQKTVVWCQDGLYVHSETGIKSDTIEQFTKLNFFDDKVIKNIFLAHTLLVQCEDGFYTVNKKSINSPRFLDNLSLDNQYEFSRLDLDPARVSCIQLTNTLYVEMDGKWQIHKDNNINAEPAATFSEMNFTAANSLLVEDKNSKCTIC